jgi:transcriptional regulator with XRE-family HTH domain
LDSLVERIEIILRSKNLSPSKLADEIGVQRSGISHIMSGRNKPSLDFILKVLDTYPDISAGWLLRGEGEMSEKDGLIDFETKAETAEDKNASEKKISVGVSSDKKAVRVLIFYDDQSYDEIISGSQKRSSLEK